MMADESGKMASGDRGTGPAARSAEVSRKTSETEIRVSLNLDGEGRRKVSTGAGFFDHMLEQIARHGLCDLEVEAAGDLHVDSHHLVEDTGIVIGQALDRALGSREGITRYGSAHVPLDEALALAAVDLGGRGFLAFNADLPKEKVGEFDSELVEEFFRGLANNARVTIHLNLLYGKNTHHMIEALFKAFARALGQAASLDPRVSGVPSTKGSI